MATLHVAFLTLGLGVSGSGNPVVHFAAQAAGGGSRQVALSAAPGRTTPGSERDGTSVASAGDAAQGVVDGMARDIEIGTMGQMARQTTGAALACAVVIAAGCQSPGARPEQSEVPQVRQVEVPSPVTSVPSCGGDEECDDGNVCNGVETCAGGRCTAGEPLRCADENPCTDDECDPQRGCVHVANDHNTCSDGEFCNGEECCRGGDCVTPGSPCGRGQVCDEATDACIDGYVREGVLRRHDGSPAVAVPLVFGGPELGNAGGAETVTDGDGYYRVVLPLGWSGAVTSDADYRVLRQHGHDPSGDDADAGDLTVFRNYYVDASAVSRPPPPEMYRPGGFAHPYSTIQEAANVVGPGDTVYIKGGQYTARNNVYSTAVLEMVSSGTAEAPIRFQNFDSEPVVLDAGAVRSTSDNGHRCGIFIGEGISHVVLAGLVVRRAFREGINVRGVHVTIEDCIIEDCGLNPTPVESAGVKFDYSRFLTVRRCVARYCYEGFGGRHAADALFEDCLAYRNGVTSTGEVLWAENGDGFQTAVARNGSDRVHFVRCVAYGNTDDGWDMSHSRDCGLSWCIAFGQNDLGLPDGDGWGFKIGNDQNETDPLKQMRRALVRYCIAFDNAATGIDPRDGLEGLFYNNTAVGNLGQYGFSTGATGHPASFFNNVSWNNGSSDLFRGDTSKTADYNNWADANGRQVPGGDQHSLRADPGFVIPDGGIDVAWQDGFAEDDVRGILPTLHHIETQVRAAFTPTDTEPQTTSIDRGTFIAYTAEAGQGTTQVPVSSDPRRCFLLGDTVQIEDAGVAVIVEVGDTEIVVDTALTFAAGAGVHLPWNGVRPDLGAVETP